LGYLDAGTTTGGADGGIAVRSSRALAQVKWKGGVAGSPDINLLFGARSTVTSKQLFFFAASDYGKTAVTYADQVGIALFTCDPVGKVEPSNQVARVFIQTNGGGVKESFERMNPFTRLNRNDLVILALLCAGFIAVGVLYVLIAA
jgi:hypothetical protein